MAVGTEGYEQFISLFIESSQALDFHQVCSDYLEFLPVGAANVIDIGSGAGQNAAALARLGFNVTAIEPMPEFLDAARKTYNDIPIKWLNGSLPDLACLGMKQEVFDFVLIESVWHHLDDEERELATIRLASIIKKNGKCALSLRNGPAGMGTRVYPTNAMDSANLFKQYGFECVLCIQSQPSIFSFKENVFWSRLVFQKL